MLLPGFLLSYYGKERQNYFTPAEVAAVTWVQDNARPGSLLVEGSRNYPTQFENYERFTYVPIDREPEGSWRELLADPVDKLDDWLERPALHRRLHPHHPLAEDRRRRPRARCRSASLDDVEIALRQSPDFRVAYDSGDAVVFSPADRSGR